MSVRIHWDNPERTVMMFTFKGEWTLYEYEEALAFGRMMQRAVGHAVDVVYNLLESTLSPLNVTSLVKKVLRIPLHNNTQRLIIVDRGKVSPTLFDHMSPQVDYHNHIEFVDDLERARSFSTIMSIMH